MAAIFLTRTSARDRARQAIEDLTIPVRAGTSGTFQNPIKSKLLAAVDTCFPGVGLTRATHLLEFMETAESLRTTQYTAAASGSYEDPANNLTRRAAALLPDPESLLKPETAKEVFALLATAVFT